MPGGKGRQWSGLWCCWFECLAVPLGDSACLFQNLQECHTACLHNLRPADRCPKRGGKQPWWKVRGVVCVVVKITLHSSPIYSIIRLYMLNQVAQYTAFDFAPSVGACCKGALI